MNFKKTTKTVLINIMEDLDYEASEYEWGTDEYEFLMEILAEIEDVIK